jgi:glycosyltransferase involved in cell wall biosynthesis
VSVRLAYLCNRYPAVSHSFIRREIEGVESAGHEVHRFSLRPAPADLPDPADQREAAITEAVLQRGVGRLLIAGAAMLLSRPGKALVSLAAAWRLAAPGWRSRTRHCAYWLEAAWLTRRLDKLQVEHLHAHFGTNPAAVALFVRALGGPPFSFTVHGPDEFDAPIALSLGRKIEGASFVVAISSYGRSQLMRWSKPSDWPKIEVIRCGLSRDFLDAPVTPVPPQSTEFVCVARLSAQKGLPLLIAACARLRDAGERFSLTIVGDGELRREIESEIRKRGLEQIVTLVGVRSGAEIREHLRRGRAFVLPSFAEGLPVVIMEALALTRPVVATAIAGIPELVDQECGWLVPAGSEDALVEAMAAALHASPEDLFRKGEIGRQRVRQLHDAGRNGAMVVEATASRQPDAIISTR